MRKIIILASLLATLLAGSAFASEESGGQPGAYLRRPTGARAMGMGQAYVAVANDLSALKYNPSGLAQMENTIARGSYTVLTLDRHQVQAGFGRKLFNNKAGIGFMWNSYGVGDIQGRNAEGEPLSTFDNTENEIIGGGAYKIGSLSLGGAVKYNTQSLADFKSTGMGYSLGAQYNMAILSDAVQLILGASLSDIQSELEWDTASGLVETVPATTRIGASVVRKFEQTSFLFSVETSQTENEDRLLSLGAEVFLLDRLALRVGLHDGDLRAGGGVNVKPIWVQYAFSEDPIDKSTVHTIGVEYHFDSKP